jgi:phage tail-like protein
MATNSRRSPDGLLSYLPEIYQTDPFIGKFLLAFEKVLFQELEQTIADVANLFDPVENTPLPHQTIQRTPTDFLPWLASWTAFSLRADLDEEIQRQFIANIVKHYQLRGTKENLQELLQIFVKGKPTITETAVSEFQIGKYSTIGKDTYLQGGPPHFFTVTIVLAETLLGNPQDLARQLEIANALIQLEKPAHTDYELIPIYPGTIQIGIRNSSILGVNTILGNMPTNNSNDE